MDAPKIKLKVRDFLKLMTSESETIVILTHDNTTLYHGVVGSFIRDKTSNVIKNSYIERISGDDYNRILIWVIEDLTKFRYIRDFEKNRILVIDLLLHVIDEERIIIYTKDGEVYKGTKEKFLKTPDGMLSKYCYREVDLFESGIMDGNPVTYIYLRGRK